MERLAELYAILRRRGLLPGKEIQKELGVSQPEMSRLMQAAGPRVARFGKARATRYVLSREVAGLGRQVPVFRVDEQGQPHRHGMLHFLGGSGYWLERETGDGQPYEGLPAFVEDMRPQGYIGRGFPARYPELGLPSRIRDWSDDHQLIALAMRGEDCVGNLILGEPSLDRFLANPLRESPRSDYAALAAGALAGQPGSSAGGEHPKFAAYSEGRHLLVKFAGGDGAAADRWRDLLVCEHVALETLNAAGIPAARSTWFDLDGTRYLELERFDRISRRGRRGVVSLWALNGQYLDPDFDTWSRASRRIQQEPSLSLSAEHADRMIRLDTFGDLIGNTDRHFGNFSFFVDEARTLALTPTPAYDMLPMVFAPADANLVERPFAPSPPTALNLRLWSEAAALALAYWSRLIEEPGLSDGFRGIMRGCWEVLGKTIERQFG